MYPSISKILIIMTIGMGSISACSNDAQTPKRYRDAAGAIERTSGDMKQGSVPQVNVQMTSLISPEYDSTSCSASNKKCVNYMQVNATPSGGASSCVPKSKKISMTGYLSYPFGEMLNAECSYSVQIDLGNQDLSSASGMFTSYYTSSGQFVIQSSQLASTIQTGKPATLKVSSFIKTANGTAAGLPEFSGILEGASAPSTGDTTGGNTGGTTGGTPGGTTGGTDAPQGNLFSGFSTISLTDSSGATSTMDKHIKGKYLFLDFSGGTGCSYCVQLANEVNKNSSFNSAIAAGKCSAITVLAVSGSYGTYSGWMSKFKGTPAGDHSYSVSSINTAAKVFGKTVSSYPTVMVIDTATGKAVSSSRDTNSFVSNYCK